MAKFNKLFIVFFLLAGSIANAQDIHFSQFNAAPLALNPAQTGNFACDWRAGLNYRNQWNSIPAPYVTYSAFFDMPLVKGIRGSDNLAAGLLLYNDVSGDGNLSNLSVLASVAYHFALGSPNHYVSLGVQGGLMQKSLEWNNLVFGNQFDGVDFNQDIISGEFYTGDNISNIDLNTGLMYKGRFSESFSLELGGAANHLLTPGESFLVADSVAALDGTTDNELGMRVTGHMRAIVALTKDISLLPAALYQTQSGAKELLVGAELGYFMRNPNFPATFYAGAYLRNGDAIIPTIALDYKNFKLGISYDVNTSNLDVATGGRGGMEISLVYTGCILPVVPENYVLPCPRY
jgi:type IX secretion system PorP/SprF family membrane protein